MGVVGGEITSNCRVPREVKLVVGYGAVEGSFSNSNEVEVVDGVVGLYEGDPGEVMSGEGVNVPMHELKIMVVRRARIQVYISVNKKQIRTLKVVNAQKGDQQSTFATA